MEPDVRKLRECVSRHIDIPPPELERISTGKFNASFYVRVGGEEYVLRVAPPDDGVFLFYEKNMMKQEPGIHKILLAKTGVPVPRVVAFDESRSVIDRDYIIMERLPGEPLSERTPPGLDEILRGVGAALSEVHAVTSDKYGYLGEHRPMQPENTWAAAFRVMWESLIRDIEKTGHYSAAECRFMERLPDKHIDVFDYDAPASLLHMDVWAQNILADGGSLSGLLDWDRALWGDPGIEFAVLDYCGISEPAFWEGYGKERDVSREARIRGVFYHLYELQKYIVIRHGRGNNPALARSYRDSALMTAGKL